MNVTRVNTNVEKWQGHENELWLHGCCDAVCCTRQQTVYVRSEGYSPEAEVRVLVGSAEKSYACTSMEQSDPQALCNEVSVMRVLRFDFPDSLSRGRLSRSFSLAGHL